jgi:cytidyltransferase-like protein
LATGVFDVLHSEHLKFLHKAKAAGDLLLVGLESDQRVKKMKGPTRPIYPAEVRKNNLEIWQLADSAFILPENFESSADHENLIKLIRPAILAVSSHTAHLPEKSAILQKYGGQVIVVHQYNPTLSTTQLLAQRAKN